MVVIRSVPLLCPSGVMLIGSFEVTRRITTFYDAEGTPVSRNMFARIEGTTTNLLTGASLPNSGVRIFHWDLTTGELFTAGSNAVTKLPDGGVDLQGAGRWVFDAAGHVIEHVGPPGAEVEQLCAALGA